MLKIVIKQLILFLKHLNIIHLDLKPHNVLMNNNEHILVTDLGCAMSVEGRKFAA